MPTQLPLDLRLQTRASFANFLPGANREVLAVVRAAAEGVGAQRVLLWGVAGCGKTHLLEAAVRCAATAGRRPLYLPLRDLSGLDPGLLDDLEGVCDLVCVDDLDTIAGRREWERALFGLHLRSDACAWLVSSVAPPAGAGFAMPELATRLGAGLVYQVQPLTDDGKRALLERRARELGLDLEPRVARYLIERHARDLTSLMWLLDRIDAESLRCQRRPTIAFIRELEV